MILGNWCECYENGLVSNEGEHVVVNQVVEEVDPSVEVGVDIGGTTPDPDFSVNEGKPRMHTTLP